MSKIRAFVLRSDGTRHALSTLDEVVEHAPNRKAIWIDVEQPKPELLKKLGAVFGLDSEALEDCLQGDQRPRIDEFEDYVFLVAYAVLGPEDPPELSPRKLAAFCSADFLITIHRKPLRTINLVYGRCERGGGKLLQRGVDFILYTILDRVVDNYVLLAEAYDHKLEELEEMSLQDAVDRDILVEVTDLRRQLVELRRIAVGQRDFLLPLARGEYDYIAKEFRDDFRHVVDHMTKAIELLDSLRELLHGVRDNYHANLSTRMNLVMQTLTIFASIMLPLTFLAGLYGMNVPLWPGAESKWAFGALLLIMVVIATVMLVLFRRRKWL